MNLLRGIHGGRRTADSAPPSHVLKNRTAKRIAIRGVDDAHPPLIIPPFGQRALTEEEISGYEYEEWARQALVRKESVTPESAARASSVDVFSVTAGWSVLAALLFVTLWVTRGHHAVFLVLAVTGLLVTLGCWLGGWWISKTSGEVTNRMARSLNIFFVVLLGGGLPVTVIVSLDDYYWRVARRDVFGFNLSLLYILLSTAAIMPAALYFWFHRQKMPVVREGFLRDIVRLDPNVQTIEDADTSYSSLIDDVYGPDASAAGAGNRTRIAGVAWGGLPIVIATLLFAALWNWTLLSAVEHREDGVIKARLAAAAQAGLADYQVASGPPPVPGFTEDPPNTGALLNPAPDIASYAFLGSYFFALSMLFRRYTRSDLSPKAYTHVCVRILTALVVAWVASQVPFLHKDSGDPNATMLLLAFLIGIVPETGTAVIQDVLRKTPGLGKAVPSLEEDHPLAKLDGISLYDRSQLLEVGIENVESLAHNNLIELRLWTRIPTPRLVDFVDQAVLYLHVRGAVNLAGDGTETTGERNSGALDLLGAYGIRTATDLERAHKAADDRGAGPAFLALLGGPDPSVPRLRVVIDALADDEWMVYLRNWRSQSLPHPPLGSVEDFVREAAGEAGGRETPLVPAAPPALVVPNKAPGVGPVEASAS